MKRFLSMILAITFFFSGCSISGERIKEPVSFYYLQSEFQYGCSGSTIVSEEREASGHRNDLLYLMKLYMMGPTNDELVSPLPRGTQVFSAEQADGVVSLHISDTADDLSDVEFSLACACLSLTCFALTDSEKVTIQSGEQTITFTTENLVLYDTIPQPTEDSP